MPGRIIRCCRRVFPHLTLPEGNTLQVPHNFYLMGRPKDAPLLHAQLQVSGVLEPVVSSGSNWTFTVSVTSDAVALFVWLQTDVAGIFSNNGFIMTQASVEVLFYADKETTKSELEASLTVMSLTDTYTTQEGLRDRAFHPNDLNNVIYLH